MTSIIDENFKPLFVIDGNKCHRSHDNLGLFRTGNPDWAWQSGIDETIACAETFLDNDGYILQCEGKDKAWEKELFSLFGITGGFIYFHHEDSRLSMKVGGWGTLRCLERLHRITPKWVNRPILARSLDAAERALAPAECDAIAKANAKEREVVEPPPTPSDPTQLGQGQGGKNKVAVKIPPPSVLDQLDKDRVAKIVMSTGHPWRLGVPQPRVIRGVFTGLKVFLALGNESDDVAARKALVPAWNLATLLMAIGGLRGLHEINYSRKHFELTDREYYLYSDAFHNKSKYGRAYFDVSMIGVKPEDKDRGKVKLSIKSEPKAPSGQRPVVDFSTGDERYSVHSKEEAMDQLIRRREMNGTLTMAAIRYLIYKNRENKIADPKEVGNHFEANPLSK